MTSTVSASSATIAPQTAHRHQRAAAASSGDPLASAGATTQAGSTPAASGTGMQSFASELQSILLSAQSGSSATQAAASTGTAQDATATATTATGAARQTADQLQSLLGGGDASATGGTGVQDVLDRLQQTLSQTLASYASAAAGPATAFTV